MNNHRTPLRKTVPEQIVAVLGDMDMAQFIEIQIAHLPGELVEILPRIELELAPFGRRVLRHVNAIGV